MKSWLHMATQRAVAQRSLRVALVVGTVLVAINQGDRLISGDITLEVILKSLLTYFVPYLVSTYASVQAMAGGKT